MIPNVYKKLERLMAEKGLKVSELAAMAGMPRQSITQLKHAKNHQARTINKLAKALGVDVGYFLD